MRNRIAASRGPHLVQACGNSGWHRPAAQILSICLGTACQRENKPAVQSRLRTTLLKPRLPAENGRMERRKGASHPLTPGACPRLSAGFARLISTMKRALARSALLPPRGGRNIERDILAPPGFSRRSRLKRWLKGFYHETIVPERIRRPPGQSYDTPVVTKPITITR